MSQLRRSVRLAVLLVVFGLLPGRASAVPPVLTVTTTADTNDGTCDSHCSLREAITAANAAGTTHIITFAIPGTGVHTITLASPLPDLVVDMTIAGLSQPGASQNTRSTGGIDAVLRIQVDGSLQSHIFRVARGHTTISGLVLARAGALVHVQPTTSAPASATIRGNFFNTTADGLAAAGGADAAIYVNNAEVTVGGQQPADRNVVAGVASVPSAGIGIFVHHGAKAYVYGNLIGVDKTGTVALPFTDAGIRVQGNPVPTLAIIGGSTPEEGNVISGAANASGTAAGVVLGCGPGCSTGSVSINQNRIGTTADGASPLPNDNGIVVNATAFATIGVDDPAQGNDIRFNRGAGVLIDAPAASGTATVSLAGNRISRNGGLGIDLRGTPGPDANDPGDADAGLQNHPVVTSVNSSGGSTTIEGTLSSAANRTYSVEVFANDEVDPSGFGEGQIPLGVVTASTGADGMAAWTLTVPRTVAPSQFVTATATSTSGGATSEFSQPRTDVRLTLQGPSGPVASGATAAYTAIVDNAAAPGFPAGPVTLAIPLPAGTTVVDAAGGAQTGGTLTIPLGVLVAGQSVSRTVTLRHGSVGITVITATATSPLFEVTPADNQASAVVTVQALYDLGGTVVDTNGTPLPNVVVSLSGDRTATTTSDASGRWQFALLPTGTYTLTASRTGLVLSPPQTFIGLASSNTALVFTAVSGTYTRYLAEGASGPFFDTHIALFNASSTPSSALLTFQRADGVTRTQAVSIPGPGRRTVFPETLPGLENSAFSTVIASDQPIVVDRTMTWDSTRYGSHAETGIVQPLTRWFLAEGATTAGFELFYLVQNANPTPANVQVRYLLTSGAPITKTYVVQPNSRYNIWVNLEDALLADAEVSADVTSDQPIIVERAMYRDVAGQSFGMGHEGAGVPQASTQWYFAEGNTGAFFDLFFLIANPTNDVAQVEATYLKPDGSTVVKPYTVSPNSRFNVWVDLEDPDLANTAVGTTFRVTNGVAVVVERAMWWAGDVSQWVEGHNTAGATQTGEKWALAEGEVSGAPFFTDTFILIANTGTTPGTVRVTLVFEDGTASVSKELPIPASARLNVMVSAEFPEAVGKRFGTIVESAGPTPLPLVVERAMYNRSNGVDFAAGTAALGARLR